MAEQPNEYDRAISAYNDIAATNRQNTGSGTDTGNVNINPNSSGYGYNILRSGSPPAGFVGSYSTPRGNLITIGGGQPPANVSGGGGGGTQRIASGGGGGGGGYAGGRSYSVGYRGPMVPKPEYKAPEFQAPDPYKAPEYAAPERDPMEEKKLRQDYMAPGMRQVRKSTAQALRQARNFDNPNVRSLFVQKALEGVGGAVSQVAGTAGREASAEAGRRYQTEMQNYLNKYTALTDEAKTNFQNDWNTAIMQYQQEVWGAQTDYSNQMATFNQMPLDYRAGQYSGDKTAGSRFGWSFNRY